MKRASTNNENHDVQAQGGNLEMIEMKCFRAGSCGFIVLVAQVSQVYTNSMVFRIYFPHDDGHEFGKATATNPAWFAKLLTIYVEISIRVCQNCLFVPAPCLVR